MNKKNIDIAVIGEGITGLCTAYWLKKRGLAVTLLAKDADAGGSMKSVSDNGFLYETGANTGTETTPLFKELVTDLHLQEEFLYAGPEEKNLFVLRNGTLIPFPSGPASFFSSDLFSAKGKLRILKEPFIGAAQKEETVAEFVSRRLGYEFLEYAADPFVAGVYAGRTEQLSVRAAFPELYAMEKNYGGLVRGMVKRAGERKRQEENSGYSSKIFSFRSGMQTLPRALAESLRSETIVHARVTGIHQPERKTSRGKRYVVEYLSKGKRQKLHTDYVICATAAYEAASILRHLSPVTSDILDSIYYAPLISLFLGYRREDVPHPMNGLGFLVPSGEHQKILGCMWNSSLFPGRAPEGHVALTAFIGGACRPELYKLSDAHIIRETMKALLSAMQVAGKPVYWNLTRWHKSIPQYTIGYQRKIDALELFERHFPGISLAGNYRGGISAGNCVQSAYKLAESLAAEIALIPKSSERNIL
jgi:oxygen-dependent protoporphyrinogen oxidase